MKDYVNNKRISVISKRLPEFTAKNEIEIKAQIKAVEFEIRKLYDNISNIIENITFRETIADIVRDMYNRGCDKILVEMDKETDEIAKLRNRPPYVTLAILATLFTCNLTMLFYVLIFIKRIF